MSIRENFGSASEGLVGSGRERRRFFRVDDDIILIYTELTEGATPDPEGFHEQAFDSFSLTAALAVLTDEFHAQLNKIDRSHPEVVDVIKILEQKISLITQALLTKELNLADHATQKVNISAAGMAFNVEKPLKPGAVLQLKLILPPSLTALMTYGKVVYCEKGSEDQAFPFQIGVDFVALRDQDRDFLARHAVKKQLHQLRNRKQNPDLS